MKSILVLLTCLGAYSLSAQEYVVTERGPHTATWQKQTQEITPRGKERIKTTSYQEIATGLNYWDDKKGRWEPTVEKINIVNGNAIADQGPHKVIFAGNLNNAEAVDLLTPDNVRLKSHVLGLLYTDLASGESVPLGSVKNTDGAVLPPNQVYYLDAFDTAGAFIADVRYTYRRSGLEQDILLRTAPPPPGAYGLPDATTVLEVITEFVDPPEPEKSKVVLKSESDQAKRQLMAEPDLVDTHLSFGAMKIGYGQAIIPDEVSQPSVDVAKQWSKIAGRTYLTERVEYSALANSLKNLPQADLGKVRKSQRIRNLADAFPTKSRIPSSNSSMQLTSYTPPENAVVIDYNLTGSVTNFTFQGDTTYYLSGGSVDLYGTTTVEGGAVFKYTNRLGNATLILHSFLTWDSSKYRPVIFTGKDDDSVGETISSSTHSPIGNCYATAAIQFQALTTFSISDAHIRYASNAIVTGGGLITLTINNSQISYVTNALAGGTKARAIFRNCLFHSGRTVFTGSFLTNEVENATFHGWGTFASGLGPTVRLTNTLLISVTNGVTYTGETVRTNLSDAGIFTTVGEGAHYLAAGSAYRDSGTNAIDSTLLSGLKLLTTYPPLLLTNNIYTDTTLSPQAGRDTDTVDLGYHYPPLDYVANGLIVSNAILTLTNGVSLATFGDSSEYGLLLENKSKLNAMGSATKMCSVVRYSTVQEQANTNWSSSTTGPAITTVDYAVTDEPEFLARFVEWSTPALDSYHVFAGFEDSPPLGFVHCQFNGGKIYSDYPNVNFTNCLFLRTDCFLSAQGGRFYNNTLYAGTNGVDSGAGTFFFHDNLFYKTAIDPSQPAVTNSHNAYVTNYVRLNNPGTGDIVLTNAPTFSVGDLGSFYYPTSDGMLSLLMGSGSRNATNAGLYHFTVRTDNTKETNSVVDIGYHYVALSGANFPFDSDADGISDYLEDVNGNGSVDSGETDWLDPGDLGLRVWITRPRRGAIIP